MNISLLFIRIYKILQVLRSRRLLRALALEKVLAGVEHRHILNPKLKTVIDIGANRGQFSLAVREWLPQARIVAFEPLPVPAQIFKRLFKDDINVQFYQAAIGPQSGKSTIHVSACDDSSSLLPISSKQVTLFPGTQEVRKEIIDVKQLEELVFKKDILKPAMLKIDVQGFEFQVLQGCKSLLNCFSTIYIECSFMELYTGQKRAHTIIDWLSENKYYLNGIHNVVYDRRGQAVQADFLFTSNAN